MPAAIRVLDQFEDLAGTLALSQVPDGLLTVGKIAPDTLGRYLSSYPPWPKRLIKPHTVVSGRIQAGSVVAIEPCDTPANWTSAGGSPTIAADTEHYLCALASYQAVKFTNVGAATGWVAQRDYGAGDDINVAGTFCYVRFYVHEGSGDSSYAHISNISIQFLDEAAAHDGAKTILASPYIKPGWHEAWLNMNLLGATADKTKLQIIYFRCTCTASKPVSVTLDEISFWPEKRPLAVYNNAGTLEPIPLVGIRLDNGFTRDYKAMAYAHAKGVPLNLAITSTLIGESGYLTLVQAQNMQRFGRHLFVNHSYTHAYQPDLTEAEAWAEYANAVGWMIANGFTRGARIYVVPGDWGRDESWTGPGVAPYDILMNQDASMVNTYGLQPVMTACVVHDNPTAADALDLGNTNPDANIDRIKVGGTAGGDFLMHYGHCTDDTVLGYVKAHIDKVCAENIANTVRPVTLDQLGALAG